MCSTVHAVYVIQKVLQKHKFTILQAYRFSAELISTNFLLIWDKTELNLASPQTRKFQNTKFDFYQIISYLLSST